MKYSISKIINLLRENDLFIETTVLNEYSINQLTYDSREVEKGALFFCKGKRFHKEFLEQAIASGAVAYVSEKKYDVSVPGIIVSDIRQAMPKVANLFYDSPWKEFNAIGITGTKGKTTTTNYIKAILDLYEKDNLQPETAFFSSSLTYDGTGTRSSSLTTPESLPLFKQLNNVKNNKIRFLTMEVSSQALKYHRVDEMIYDVIGFMNISPDHIGEGEHESFEDYFQSKLEIFNYGKTAVINMDSDYVEEIMHTAQKSDMVEQIITFSRYNKQADYWVSDITVNKKGQTFNVHSPEGVYTMALGMPGEFNIDNALMAIAVSRHYGVSFEIIKEALNDVKTPGRMEVFNTKDQKLKVIVDFAHNKLSMEQVILSAKKMYPNTKVWVAVGSAGNKGISRRKDIGEVLAKLADKAYLIPEDSNYENPISISNEIKRAALTQLDTFDAQVISGSRHDGIRQALNDIAEFEEDVVLIVAGKGTDDYLIIEGEKIPYQSDSAFVQEYIETYDKR